VDVRGKVAVVTGGTSGIGRATARALARKGASLLVVARDEARLADVKRELLAAGSPRVETLSADLSTSRGIDETIIAAVRSFDGFDILVNNAGAGLKKRLVDTTEEDFDRLVGLNLRAVYFLTQAAVKVMRRRGGGQVVQVASGVAYRGYADSSLYAATKFALRGLTESVREEVAQEGIKVGIVAPGYTRTRFFEDFPDRAQRSFEGALEPDDVAHVVMAMVEQAPTSDIKEIQVRNPRSP